MPYNSNDNPYNPHGPETPAERTLRRLDLQAQIQAGTYNPASGLEVVKRLEERRIAHHAAVDRTGQRRIVTCFGGEPSILWVDDPMMPEEERALYAEFWTEQSRQSAENARRARQWKQGMADLAVAVQNATEQATEPEEAACEEPEETPRERIVRLRIAAVFWAAYTVIGSEAAIWFGRALGWWR